HGPSKLPRLRLSVSKRSVCARYAPGAVDPVERPSDAFRRRDEAERVVAIGAEARRQGLPAHAASALPPKHATLCRVTVRRGNEVEIEASDGATESLARSAVRIAKQRWLEQSIGVVVKGDRACVPRVVVRDPSADVHEDAFLEIFRGPHPAFGAEHSSVVGDN